MRVLHVDTGREMRGGQWQVLHLLRHARGHEHSLAAREGTPLYDAAKKDGLAVYPLGLAPPFPPDLVHAHDARAHTRAALWNVPFVVSRRVAFPVNRGILSRLKYRRASRFLAVSNAVRQRLIEAGVDKTRIEVVYDGVPGMPRSSRLGSVAAPFTADPRKGSDIVKEAARLCGVDVRFSTSLPADLAHARLFVYLSREEGLGSAVLMAMAAGVPVVASRIGGLPEAVADGVTGLLVDNDPAQVAAAIHCLLHEESRAEAMSAAAVERWRAEFAVDKMVERTEAVYRECAG
jgi:glycosyltransferase involved in cell wall biosynthesis